MTRRPPAIVCLGLSLAVGALASVAEADGQQAPAAPAASSMSNVSSASSVSNASDASSASDPSAAAGSVSLDRIRAGLQRPIFLAGERAKDETPMFRTEVTGHVIKLRNYWSDRDPDLEPDPFTWPVPSAAELLVNYAILKPRAALRARKERALKQQIQREIQQIEQQRDAAPPPPSPPPPR